MTGRTAQAPIVTVTMNPALDISTSVERVAPEHKLRCAASRTDPGGGGVNVARAVQSLGGSTTAIHTLGGLTGDLYRQALAAEGIDGHPVKIRGETRESFTVDETSSGRQFRFVLPGPTLTAAEWKACISIVADHVPHGGYLVASGSLPPGVPEDFYARLARIAAAENARMVVDASGPALQAALDEGVYLVKPSRRELTELVRSRRELDAAEQAEAVSAIVRDGRAELVALTVGAQGALLASADGVIRMPVPDVQLASAVGAGDAFLAGFVLRLAQGRSLTDALRTGVAAGSATATMAGTGVCRRSDVEAIEAVLPV